MTQSAIGSAWTPAEFVSSTPEPTCPRLEPMPAVALWAQPSVFFAAPATPEGIPQTTEISAPRAADIAFGAPGPPPPFETPRPFPSWTSPPTRTQVLISDYF